MSTTCYTSAVPQESVWGFNPCGIFCGITMYHTSTTALLCGILWYIFFFCGISYGIFSTTWVPQATLLQYHRTLCGTSLSLWYFLWYYAVPQEYHRNTTRYFCKGMIIAFSVQGAQRPLETHWAFAPEPHQAGADPGFSFRGRKR